MTSVDLKKKKKSSITTVVNYERFQHLLLGNLSRTDLSAILASTYILNCWLSNALSDTTNCAVMEAIRHVLSWIKTIQAMYPTIPSLNKFLLSLLLTVCATPPRLLHAPCEQLFVSLLISPSLCLPHLASVSREIGNLAKKKQKCRKHRKDQRNYK